MAFKMKGNPMSRNFGIGKHGVNVKTPNPGIKRDEGNTDLADGRSGSSPFQVDLKKAATGVGKFARKAYDKASQIGEGIKAGVGRTLRASRTENVGYSARVGIKAAKKAYKAEKKADEAAATRRSAGKAAKKVKPKAPTKKQNMEAVKKMKTRKAKAKMAKMDKTVKGPKASASEKKRLNEKMNKAVSGKEKMRIITDSEGNLISKKSPGKKYGKKSPAKNYKKGYYGVK
tara:strand:- start:78 stop:767 length:690 start_codon:yes stop_codon:yes gene_type:complete